MTTLVYFSSSSENTHRFMLRLALPAIRIPLNERERIQVDEPYILIVPSYGGGGTAGAVPRQVIRFLNDPHNRALIRGVIASGNRNFGEAYGRAGEVVSQKCGVPWLYRFELMGTQSDIENVRKGVSEFWQRQPQNAQSSPRWIITP
ncbi:TPA: class Ib ribonucleoside-diphosphate reductase assembly flavoprotein NrdI [Citrobacter freundii]|nr:class Ib ribonucleoside-diphosphate reductase assembly flavoprotein NrdI [Citrobacter freundii]